MNPSQVPTASLLLSEPTTSSAMAIAPSPVLTGWLARQSMSS